jgi:hypothetical protein
MGVSFEAVARSAGLMVTLWGRSWGLRPRLYANACSARSRLACRGKVTPPLDRLFPDPYQ